MDNYNILSSVGIGRVYPGRGEITMKDKLAAIGEAFLNAGFKDAGLHPDFEKRLTLFFDDEKHDIQYYKGDFRNDLSKVLFDKDYILIKKRCKMLVKLLEKMIRKQKVK